MFNPEAGFAVCFFVTIAFLLSAKATDDKVDCVNKLSDWCDEMEYSNYGFGSSILSTTDVDDSGNYQHVFCITDSEGTNCNRNKSPWFSCSPDNKATYKGKSLQKNSTNGVDEEICYTVRKINSGYLGSILSFKKANLTELKKGLDEGRKQLNKAMSDLHENLGNLRKNIFRNCFPFCSNNPFGKNFPFNSGDSDYSDY